VGVIDTVERHLEGELVVGLLKVFLLKDHSLVELLLIVLKKVDDLIFVLRGSNFLLEGLKSLLDESLVLVELSESLHVEHVSTDSVGGLKIWVTVLLEIEASLSLHVQ